MENRFSPRVDVQMKAVISITENLSLNVTTFNLSQKGIGIQCNTMMRNLITPGGCFMQGLDPLELGVTLEVPGSDDVSRQMKARCQVVYSRRIAKEQCQIGLQFKGIDAGSREFLQEVIESVLSLNRQPDQLKLQK